MRPLVALSIFFLLIIAGCMEVQRNGSESINYLSTSPSVCSQTAFACHSGAEAFSNTSGCGCQGTGNLEPIIGTRCTEDMRGAEACTAIYAPVCGWYANETECDSYPCAETFSNSCLACTNATIAFYTPGECPTV